MELEDGMMAGAVMRRRMPGPTACRVSGWRGENAMRTGIQSVGSLLQTTGGCVSTGLQVVTLREATQVMCRRTRRTGTTTVVGITRAGGVSLAGFHADDRPSSNLGN